MFHQRIQLTIIVSDDDKKVFREEMNQLEELFKDKVKDNQIEELAKGLLLPLFGMGYFLFQLHSVGDRVKNRVLPYTSACIPGNRLFIDVKGNFHMCEKANQHFAIGDLDTGLDHNKIQDIINRYNSQLTNCHRCPISRLCDFCYVSLMKEKNFVLERQTCQDKIKDIKELLKNYVDMMEQSPQAMHKLMGDIEATLVNTHKKMGLC